MGFKIDFGDNERGASPVVGVVLLVAVTVVVGSVVAAFVFDLGRNSTDSMPNAQLNVEDAGPVLSDENSEDVVNINHDSGDDVETADLLLRISQQDGTTVYEDVMREDTYAAQPGGYGPLNVTGGSAPAELEASGSLTLTEDADDAFSSGTYDFTIIYEPSDGILLEETVDID